MAVNKKIWLGIEFCLLFIGVPLLIFFEKKLIHPTVVLPPILITLILYFRKQKDFKAKDLIHLDIDKKCWIKQALLVLVSCVFLLAYVLLFEPGNLFNLPKGNKTIWLAMLFFYPVFSAFGQEVIYRKFLFMRYDSLFRNKWLLIFASALVFSFVHIIFFNVLSLILTFILGLYLAWLYDKTRSVMLTSILHGILGWLIFTVGLGQHFWLDMMKWI